VRVFLDADVLFSASRSGSNIARLVAWLTEKGTAVTSDLAIQEARRNLARKRNEWMATFEKLLPGPEEVPSALFDLPVPLDPKDRPLLCAAIRSRCRLFVTGDRRDFGHLYGRTVGSVEVVSLLRLAELLAQPRNDG